MSRRTKGQFERSTRRSSTGRSYPRVVVTEYAWDAMSCDPLPPPSRRRSSVTCSASTQCRPATSGSPADASAEDDAHASTRAMRRTRSARTIVFTPPRPSLGGREMRDMRALRARRDREPAPTTTSGRYAVRHHGRAPSDYRARSAGMEPPGDARGRRRRRTWQRRAEAISRPRGRRRTFALGRSDAIGSPSRRAHAPATTTTDDAGTPSPSLNAERYLP